MSRVEEFVWWSREVAESICNDKWHEEDVAEGWKAILRRDVLWARLSEDERREALESLFDHATREAS